MPSGLSRPRNVRGEREARARESGGDMFHQHPVSERNNDTLEKYGRPKF